MDYRRQWKRPQNPQHVGRCLIWFVRWRRRHIWTICKRFWTSSWNDRLRFTINSVIWYWHAIPSFRFGREFSLFANVCSVIFRLLANYEIHSTMGHFMFAANYIIRCCAALQWKIVRRSNAAAEMDEFISGIAGVRCAANTSDDVSVDVDLNKFVGHCNTWNAFGTTAAAHQERTTEIVPRRFGHAHIRIRNTTIAIEASVYELVVLVAWLQYAFGTFGQRCSGARVNHSTLLRR